MTTMMLLDADDDTNAVRAFMASPSSRNARSRQAQVHHMSFPGYLEVARRPSSIGGPCSRLAD